MMPEASPLTAPLFALAAALQFAAGALLAKRGLQHLDAVTGATVSIAASLACYLLAAPFALHAADWASPAVWVFAAIGVLRPSVSTMLAYEGTRRLGPTIGSTFESMSPLFAVAGGVLFLHEGLSATSALGTLGVVTGALVLSAKGRLPRSWPLWALLLPLGASLIRSSAHVAARWGLLMLPSVVLAGLVAYAVSFAVALLVAGGRPAGRRAVLNRPGVLWFAATGLANGGAVFCLNSALLLGKVVVVAPVTGAYPLFTLLGSWLFLRQETITPRTVLCVLLIVPSVALVMLGR